MVLGNHIESVLITQGHLSGGGASVEQIRKPLQDPSYNLNLSESD